VVAMASMAAKQRLGGCHPRLPDQVCETSESKEGGVAFDRRSAKGLIRTRTCPGRATIERLRQSAGELAAD
jgi:hypothetical protein